MALVGKAWGGAVKAAGILGVVSIAGVSIFGAYNFFGTVVIISAICAFLAMGARLFR